VADSRRVGVTDTVPVVPAEATEHPRTLSLRGATVLGIGSMIGAGICALLGEAVLGIARCAVVRPFAWR
jgi:hypothetical protein